MPDLTAFVSSEEVEEALRQSVAGFAEVDVDRITISMDLPRRRLSTVDYGIVALKLGTIWCGLASTANGEESRLLQALNPSVLVRYSIAADEEGFNSIIGLMRRITQDSLKDSLNGELAKTGSDMKVVSVASIVAAEVNLLYPPTTTEEDDEFPTELHLIIGGSIIGTLLLCSVAIIIVVCYWRRTQSTHAAYKAKESSGACATDGSSAVSGVARGPSVDSFSHPAPTHWKHQDLTVDFFSREEATALEKEGIQKMFDATFKAVSTRDRTSRMPKRLKVYNVQRVENARLWRRYCEVIDRTQEKRDRICSRLDQSRGGEVKTVDSSAALPGTVNPAINEVFLWHGTSAQKVFSISQGGFDLHMAGSVAGSLYGKGVYCAECSSKSDEYSIEDDASRAQGPHKELHCMCLCRVVLGEVLTLTTGGEAVHKTIESAIHSQAYDSVMGDREASVGTYREFVVYEETRVYPEYIVLYRREYD